MTHTSWRWAFFVTLPVVAIATSLFLYGYVEPPKKARPAGNWRGAVLLRLTLAALIVGVSKTFDPLLLGIAGTLAIPFLLLERSAARPILPPDLFANRAFIVSALTLFFAGAVQVGDLAFLGLYFQGVAGVDPATSGYLQAVPMTAVAIVSAFFVGRVIKKHGYRLVVRIGALFAALATVALALAAWQQADHPESVMPVVLVIVGQACIGICHGFATTGAIICVQNQVAQARRGTATASLSLARGLGSALAPAVLGILFLAALQSQHLSLTPEQFLNQKTLSGLDPTALAEARAGLGEAPRTLLPAWIGIGVAAWVTSLFFPEAVADVASKP